MRISLILLAFAPGAALAGPALAQSVQLAGQGVNLAMSLQASAPQDQAAAAPEVSSQAALTGEVAGLQTRVQLGMKTGQHTPEAPTPEWGWWHSTDAGVNAAWTPFRSAKVEIGAQNSTRIQFTGSDPVLPNVSQHYAESRQSGLSAQATLTPFPAVDVKLGARVSSSAEQDASIAGAGAEVSDLTQSDTRQVSAALAFAPFAAARFEAGGQVQSTGLVWSGGRADSYASLDPSARLSTTPWAGGSLQLSAAHATAPLTIDQFVGYGQGVAALQGVQPSREWRYGAALTQKAGPVDLKAGLTEAQVQTFAYLAPTPGAQARMGLGGGERSEVSAGMDAPVAVPGLRPFKLEAEATWRASAVGDPLTGALGRMSGERPYDASLSLSQAVGDEMSWGVTAQAQGPQTNLWASEVSSLSSSAGLGGFLQYNARPLSVRLTLDNIVGGVRAERDVYYVGARDLNQIDHSGATRTVDRGVHIALIRPL